MIGENLLSSVEVILRLSAIVEFQLNRSPNRPPVSVAVCQPSVEHQVSDVEAFSESCARQCIRVQCDDVLEAVGICTIRTELQGLCHLTFVHSVEEMAIMH